MRLTRSHPRSAQLELAYLGESSCDVSEHLSSCLECQATLRALDREQAALLQREPSREYVLKLRAQYHESQRRGLRRTIFGVLAVAAAFAAFLAHGRGSDEGARPLLASNETLPLSLLVDPGNGELRSGELLPKGDIGVSVIRKREGEQWQFSGKVSVAPGDQIRIRFVLEERGPVLAGIETDRGEWIELLDTTLPAGVHIPSATLGITSDPGGGRILVGSPQTVRAARSGAAVPSVGQVQLVWQRDGRQMRRGDHGGL